MKNLEFSFQVFMPRKTSKISLKLKFKNKKKNTSHLVMDNLRTR